MRSTDAPVHLGSAYEGPLEVVRDFCKEWGITILSACEREIKFFVQGSAGVHLAVFFWMKDEDVFLLSLSFDVTLPLHTRAEIDRLLALVNSQLWVGHMEAWSESGTVLFRHGMPLIDSSVTDAQCAALFGTALRVCDQYYAAFKAVAEGTILAHDAFTLCAYATAGEA